MSGSSVLNLAPTYTIGEPGVAKGAAATPINFTLTPSQPTATVNLQTMPTGTIQLSHLQTLKIDNSANAIGLVVTFTDTGDQLLLAPYEYGYYPVHTGSLVFTVAAPLIASLSQVSGIPQVTVKMQALNYYVPPARNFALNATTDTGYSVTINAGAAAWNTLAATVPGPPGAVFTSIYANQAAIGIVIVVQGSDIGGAAWSQTLQPAAAGEYPIPPTSAGQPLTIIAYLPANNVSRSKTTSSFTLVFRAQPLGIPVVSTVGAPGQIVNSIATGLATGFTSFFTAAGLATPFVNLQGVSVTYGGYTTGITVAIAEFNSGSPSVTALLSEFVIVSGQNGFLVLPPMNWFNAATPWAIGVQNTSGVGSGAGVLALSFTVGGTYACQNAHT